MFAVIVFVLLLVLPVNAGGFSVQLGRALFFIVGAVFSAAVGYIGMTLATQANVRVAAAARGGVRERGFHVAFRTGGIVGMLTVGLGLLGASVVLLDLQLQRADGARRFRLRGRAARHVHARRRRHLHQGRRRRRRPRRQGRGRHPRGRPAQRRHDRRQRRRQRRRLRRHGRRPVRVLRRHAGGRADPRPDRVRRQGPAAATDHRRDRHRQLVRRHPDDQPAPESDRNGLVPINRGFFITAGVSLVLVAIASRSCSCRRPSAKLPDHVCRTPRASVPPWSSRSWRCSSASSSRWRSSRSPATSPTPSRRPVKDVADTSLTGAATVILSGISLGLESAVYSAILIGLALFGAFLLGGGSVFVARSTPLRSPAAGLLTTAGVIVAMDTFGPVSDNAQGIAEMSGDIDEAGARVLTDLDAVGNTTKAITKGIAIATAVLAATALFGSFGKRLHPGSGRTPWGPGSTRPDRSARSPDFTGVFSLVQRQQADAADVQSGSHPTEQPLRRHHRCLGRVPVQRSRDQCGRTRRGPRGLRGARAVPRPPRDHGLHRASRLQPRRRHLHQGLAARAGHARTAGDLRADQRSASCSASARWPATWPVRSAPAC